MEYSHQSSTRGLCAAALAAVLMVASSTATAAPVGYTYQLAHFGVAGVGSIQGSFLGDDLDGNGVIESALGEVSGFVLNWSPAPGLPFMPFNGQYGYEVVFSLASNSTDASNGVDVVGLFSTPSNGPPIPCVPGAQCTFISAVNGMTGVSDFTPILSSTPEPVAVGLLGLGFGLVGVTRRRRRPR